MWDVVYDGDGDQPVIAISIQYEIENFQYMMPQFVEQLKVPLITIADSRSY